MHKLWFFLSLLILMSSCEKDQVQLPFGPGTATVDSVLLSRDDFDSLTVKYNSSSSSSSIYNYVGGYRDADCKTVLIFTNFTPLHDTDADADSLVVNNARIILSEYQTWGSPESFTFQTYLIPQTEEYTWSDTSDFDTYWQSVSPQLAPLNAFPYTPDSLIIPIGTDIADSWWDPEEDVTNNGIVLNYDAGGQEGMAGYYSSDYNSVSNWPRLELNCTVFDSSGTKDSTFTVYANRDFTYSELRNTESAPPFFVSQGAIRRAFITSSRFLPAVQGKSINYAELSLTVNQSESHFDEDSLTVYIGLFTSEDWETKNFLFSSYQNPAKIYKDHLNVSIPITEVIMDLQDNSGAAVSGLFIRLGSELYGFNQIAFDPDSVKMKIVSTEF
ncbi:MAG: hypothetical protein DRP86_02045 [Candidatus Neomarinimicrobiota bacterium]|nr:MAG: hypothetical protein DRP86_02045 [Candidatus Neomarinimicrobiota bacterium]